MHLRPFGQESLSSALAAAGESGAAAFRLHAGTKTMLTFSGSLGGLIRAFHDSGTVSTVGIICQSGSGPATLRVDPLLSIEARLLSLPARRGGSAIEQIVI
jgi:hypothetical protein